MKKLKYGFIVALVLINQLIKLINEYCRYFYEVSVKNRSVYVQKKPQIRRMS